MSYPTIDIFPMLDTPQRFKVRVWTFHPLLGQVKGYENEIYDTVCQARKRVKELKIQWGLIGRD